MNVLKKISAAVVAGACLISLAACGGSASGEATDLTYPQIKLGETGKDLNTTIKLFNHRTDMAQATYPGTNWDAYIKEFNKVYPNIKVEVQTSSNYASDALTRLQGGDWGDIMMIPAVDASELGTYFLPYGSLDDMKKEIKYATNQRYDGKTYGVPSAGNGMGVVYNTKVFSDAGITDLPKTPDEFINDLKLIKDKEPGVTPMYTNYAAGWTMTAWDAYIGATSTGDAKYLNQKLLHTKDPFSDPGDGTHPYNVYKVLYDAVANDLTEDDYSTTDWETSKAKLNNGEYGAMVLGAWAVAQIKSAGDNPDNVAYMPFPITVDGKQYSSSSADYAYGINKDSSKENQEASMIFVKWMTEKSGYAMNEGGIPVKQGDDELPSVYEHFNDVTFLEDEPSVDGEEDLFNDLNSDSELAINADGSSRLQAVIEAAANGTKSYDDIVKEWNQQWNSALDTEGVDVKYTTAE
ncbi:ABC transporter substrate-binding protein [Bifidobacterium tissieri]|uniref:Carbohydrate ABC transporter substrate-binding protein n=2 Tax=Bifidobacterium TaxID=1678 RepID=A0A5M9ZRQ2_9BIFI|nr:ABC transporter substrate-binding protein [Bifidobacterium tissieri]KAA8827871.1 carbohydrate ABC transporter substrate-binding protein [Bifidobacterium tissieri]KAA8829993.1 carbohydrate ABC transporter substrate-binding protein [Bifidobacterium tissieri]